MSGVIERVEVVDASKIEPMPIKIRKMRPDERALLYRSIAELGYVEPIQVCLYTERTDLVDREPPFYLIVNGQHRYEVLVEDLRANQVSVVVLGENWEKIKYWSEAIRLNNIRGDYDILKLADRVREIKQSIPDWGMLRERLGFTPTDKIFNRVISFLEGIDKKAAKELKEKIQKDDVDVNQLFEIFKDVVSKMGSQRMRVVVFSYRGEKFMVFNCDDDLWEKLMVTKEKEGPERVYEIFRQSFMV